MAQFSVTLKDIKDVLPYAKVLFLKNPVAFIRTVFFFVLITPIIYFLTNKLKQHAKNSAKDSSSIRKRRKMEAIEALKEARKELSILHTNDFEIVKGNSNRYHSRMDELSRKLRIIDSKLGKDFLDLFKPTRLIKVAKEYYTKIGKMRDPKVIDYFESIKKDYRNQLESVRDRIDKKLKKY